MCFDDGWSSRSYVFTKKNAIVEWRRLMGPTNVDAAKKDAPKSIRALYGEDMTKNAVHGSDPVDTTNVVDIHAKRELAFFFEEDTFAMIKPNALKHKDEIIKAIEEEGLTIVKSKQVKLEPSQAETFYGEHKAKSFFRELIDFMTKEGDVIAFHLRGPCAIKTWRQLMGPTDPKVAKKEAPHCLRAKYSSSLTKNATHGSDSLDSAARELGLAFGKEGFAV